MGAYLCMIYYILYIVYSQIYICRRPQWQQFISLAQLCVLALVPSTSGCRYTKASLYFKFNFFSRLINMTRSTQASLYLNLKILAYSSLRPGLSLLAPQTSILAKIGPCHQVISSSFSSFIMLQSESSPESSSESPG